MLDLRITRRDMIKAPVEVAGERRDVLGKLRRIENFREPPQPHSRFTDGGKSTQPNGIFGDRCTRPARTAATCDQTGSLRTFAAKSRSMVTMTSGFHSSTCSTETMARPPFRSA